MLTGKRVMCDVSETRRSTQGGKSNTLENAADSANMFFLLFSVFVYLRVPTPQM